MNDSLADRLEAMLAKGEDNPLLRFGLGNSYFNEKRFEQALSHLHALLEQDPSHSAGWTWRTVSIAGWWIRSSTSSASACMHATDRASRAFYAGAIS